MPSALERVLPQRSSGEGKKQSVKGRKRSFAELRKRGVGHR